jgi:ADP-dependent NAD(P)H-hydrate dehydratase / NAD(P)H-hydrate epimerase
MISLVTATAMKTIDSLSIAGDITVGYFLMQQAGKGIADTVMAIVPNPSVGEIAVLCGKGNNGGDGFVAARILHDAGYRIMCFGVIRPEELSGEAKMAYEQYIGGMGNFLVLDDVTDAGDLSHYVLILDALLGIGLQGNPHGVTAEVIALVNQSSVPVLAVDTPSGLDCERGVPAEPCIMADYTVTMGFQKLGHCFYPGKAHVGRCSIVPLHYPEAVVQKNLSGISIPEHKDYAALLPPRKPWGSKFDHGVAAMMCGSRGMTGSAQLASRAAMRTGCGMVHLAAPQSLLPILAGGLTEVVLHGIAETEDGTPSIQAEQEFIALAQRSQAVCIGSGISHNESTSRLVCKLVSLLENPMILDADGLNAFKDHPEELKKRKADLLITPHAGEWARLFAPLPAEPAEACALLSATARDYGMTIVYKGSPTIIADAKGKIYILPVGNSGMATAGSGDVLSGIIVSLIAQGCSVTHAALLGVYLHGAAGDAAAQKLTEYSVIAGDLVENINKGIRTLIA